MKNVLILGDSYSTFEGHIPSAYKPYYPKFDVNSVEDTWWKQVLKKMDGNLLENNSWSGSTIGYTGRKHEDASKTSSFIYRYKQLKELGFFDEHRVDTVFLFGGTNDSWCDGQSKFN